MWWCRAFCSYRTTLARSVISARPPAKPCTAACIAVNPSIISRRINESVLSIESGLGGQEYPGCGSRYFRRSDPTARYLCLSARPVSDLAHPARRRRTTPFLFDLRGTWRQAAKGGDQEPERWRIFQWGHTAFVDRPGARGQAARRSDR